ncbi:MAG: HD domain-containing protein [Syntrophales bacterium]|nr:HD domain-containing protein [Syntrophales bacterium]
MKTKNSYVKDIRPGERISDSFLVTEKNLSFSQKGAPYLNLRLKDKTGEVEGRVWDNAVEWDPVFKRGDVIYVQGRAASFRNVLQLSLSEIRKVDDDTLDLADYFPAAKDDPDKMFSDLMALVEQISTPCLKELLLAFFQDEAITASFKKAPAAKSLHHAYIGGLLEHTLSVTTLLALAAEHYQGINRDLLITGGVLHDIGKIHELYHHRTIDYTDQGRLIGHIVIGLEMLNAKIAVIADFPQELAMELRHLLLSHHGMLEYGSPKRPKTLESLLVYFMDDSPDDESGWTPFHKLFERFLYKGRQVIG